MWLPKRHLKIKFPLAINLYWCIAIRTINSFKQLKYALQLKVLNFTNFVAKLQVVHIT